MDLTSLKDLVQNTINDGANTVEEVHKKIANMPIDALKKLHVLEDKVDTVAEVQESTIGTVYDTIRAVNDKAGEIATEILGKIKK